MNTYSEPELASRDQSGHFGAEGQAAMCQNRSRSVLKRQTLTGVVPSLATELRHQYGARELIGVLQWA